MPRSFRNFAAVGALVIFPAAVSAVDASAAPRPVSLAQASVAPDAVASVPAGHSVRLTLRCSVSDVSAYAGTGGALGAQTRRGSSLVWRAPTGNVVRRADGSFANRSRETVLVAGWCG